MAPIWTNPFTATDAHDTGRDAPAPVGCLARDLHSVQVRVAGRDVTVEAVPVPEIFFHRVKADPAAALPFVVAKLNRSAAVDVDAVMAQARAADFVVEQLPVGVRDVAVGRYAAAAAAFADEVTADVAVRNLIAAVDPAYGTLDEYAAVAAAFGAHAAVVLAALDEVRFDIVTTKTADSYGDSSAATVTATRGDRVAVYEIGGGVMPLGTFLAAAKLCRDARRERDVVVSLFDPAEVEALAAFSLRH